MKEWENYAVFKVWRPNGEKPCHIACIPDKHLKHLYNYICHEIPDAKKRSEFKTPDGKRLTNLEWYEMLVVWRKIVKEECQHRELPGFVG